MPAREGQPRDGTNGHHLKTSEAWNKYPKVGIPHRTTTVTPPDRFRRQYPDWIFRQGNVQLYPIYIQADAL